MIKKIRNLKFVIRNCKAGMSYVELIVVLSIFAVLSSVITFNYGAFQDRVDIKNLASDIALKIVEAQKSSIDGVSPNSFPSDKKPSYGIYFDIATNNKFVYFADQNNNGKYPGPIDCTPAECLDVIEITKNNIISNLDKCSASPCVSGSSPISPLNITFIRPDSGAKFDGATIAGSEYVQLTIKSPKDATALIKIYPSGRVQVN